jgi:two-component system cell cycle sensor histidine kinase/response regulator CckA
VGRLAGGIAHDFNNLLTVIRGRSLLLLERLREAGPSRRDAELIEATARRAASLTSKLLAFSRRQVLQPRAVDLSRLLGELVPVLQRLLGEQIRLHTHLPPGVVTRVDPALFEQVVVNLVVNARDAMPGGGELRLATALVEVDEGRARDAQVAPGRYAVVAVTDTGTGMTDEVRRHLFEPFFTTKDPGRGTGLGLSSVHAVVRQHGGFVAVETALRVGTTFEVYVPATAEPPVPVEPERVAAPGAVAPATILVVEDDLDVRHTIREVLERLGHTVLEAGHPEVARVIADTHPGRIDLVLTDAVLPGTSGLAMANALAQRRPETRLLVMSGYAEAPDAQSLVEAAGRPLLRKPFTPDELAAAVQTALS